MAHTFDDKYIEYKSKGDEKHWIEQYHQKIRPYLGDSIVSLRTYGEWKIHLTMNKISNLEPLKNSKIIS